MKEQNKNIILYATIAVLLLLLPLAAMTRGIVNVDFHEVVLFLVDPTNP